MEWYNDMASIVGLSNQAQPQPPNSLAHWMVPSLNPNPNPSQEIPQDPNIESQSDDDDDAGDSDSSEYVPSDSEPEQEDEIDIVQPISPKSPSQKKRGRPFGAQNVGGGANGTDNTCKICNKSFTAFSSLQRHEVTTHSENTKRFSCEHCGMKFTQKPSLVTHIKNKHLGQLDYPCPHCERKFVKNCLLQEHIGRHHRDPNKIASNLQKCPECGKEVLNLKSHLLCHSTIQYKCDICEKTMTRKSVLVKHMKLHSTPLLKPFSCPHCPQKFKRAYCVPEHIRRCHLVERDFESKYCGTKFPHRSTRNRHDENHRLKGICVKYKPKRIFACEYCEERLDSAYLLKIHMKRKHPKPRLVLQKMKVKNISLKENPESGLFLVRGEKEQGKESGSGHPWYLCLKCGHAFLDLNKARRHNNFCDVVPVSLSPAENQDIEPETTSRTVENGIDEEETVPEPEPEPIIPNIDLDPDLPVTPTPTLGLDDKPQRIEPQIISSDDDEPMDYFDEAFGEDEVEDLNLSTIDEGVHSDATKGSIQTVEDSVEPEIMKNSGKSNSNQFIEPITATTTESMTETQAELATATMTDPATATSSKPVSLATILALPRERRVEGRPISSIPAELRPTTPWQIEHMNVVLTAPKPFQCKTCLKFFGSKAGVKEHIKLHEEPKHCCAYCGKTFYKDNVWRIHERTHTGEKPYKCKYCDYRTGNPSDLYNHERTHPESGKQPKPPRIRSRRKQTCPVCNKTLKAMEFKSHMYFQHEKDPSKGLPYTCTICNSTFAYKSNAVSHVKSIHSDEVKKVGATNRASIFEHNFLLEDKSLLPSSASISRPRGRPNDNESKEPEEIDDDSEFQDLAQVKIT